ncbi:LptA/OstA family protein [Martelella radicis]|uniref:Lipopolysaccharide export system protein LptA n=1 Tax=Martelella radicis TaxID=1397476 RepID=A0A7W6KME6_9HYPH|nr:LptA/OstA family protein [Martelella radicis]MBB4123903.1 lipopolysaccharide export system protein LptA [Martelella radicis]
MDLSNLKFCTPRRSTAATLALLCALALPAGQGFAQSTQTSGFQLSGDEPIDIDADEFEVDDATKLITFSGNVVANQGVNQVKAGKMTVRYAGGSTGIASGQGDIERIDLSQSVELLTDTQTATGDTGYFDMVTQHFVLEGNEVVLKENGNVFVGCKLTVNMVTSQAKLDACGKRVQIRLNPQSRPGD